MGKGRGSSSSDTMTTTTNVTMHHGYYGGGSSQYGSNYGGYNTAYGAGSMMGGAPGSVYGGMQPGSVYGAGGLQPGSVYGAGAPGSVYGGGMNSFGPGSAYGGAGSMYGGAPATTLQVPGNPYGNRTAESVSMSIGGGPTNMSVAPPATGYGPPLGVTSIGQGNQPVVTVPALGPSTLQGGRAGGVGVGVGGVGTGVGLGSTSNFTSSNTSSTNFAPGGTGFNTANNSSLGNNNNNSGNNNNNQGNNVPVAALNTNTSTTATRVGSPATATANSSNAVGTSSGKGRIFGQALVLDNGGGLCKIGFAGEQYPRSVFPSLVGRPKHSGIMSSDKLYVGSEAQIKRGILTLGHPIEHGVIKDWNYQELVWNCAWREELRVRPEDYPVLVTEAPLNPRRNREDAAQLLFEKFKVPALYIASEAPLALYALGRKTGLVLEMGHGVMHTVPVVDGYTIGNAILRLNAAGDDITTYLERLLKERGYSFPTTAEHEIVQDIKEKLGYVATDYEAEMKKPVEKNYELPDGQKITVGNERFRCTEILFKPALLGMDTHGVHQMVAQSVEKCNMTLRNELLSNIVLSGGTSMFPGFPERLLKELQQLVPHNANISIIAHPQRKYAVWHGGSVLASHPDFQSMWITKQAYEEHGPSILHDKIYQ